MKLCTKGEGFVSGDKWKEDLLLRLKKDAKVVKTFADDHEYQVWGLPFFTHIPEDAKRRFTDAMEEFMIR